MKKENAWKMLIEYLHDDKFIIHSDFIEDLKKILSKNLKGQERNFFNLFLKQLDYILSLSEYGVSVANTNEILKYCNDFKCYSLHISSKVFNIRILGTYINGKFVFLVAFFEISKKSKTNYSSYIDIAKNRLKEIKEEIFDE